MKIVIIRHGQTYANVLNRSGKTLFTGNLNNHLTDLTQEGIESAKKLSEKSEIKDIQIVYCSDLNRAIQTAKLAKPGFELHIDKRLRERDLGIFEGKTKEELLELDDIKKYILDSNYNKFRADFIQKAPGGENFTDVAKRTEEFLNSLNQNDDVTIGIFSHINCIKCLFLNLFNIDPKEDVINLKIKNCEPYIIEKQKDSRARLLSHKLEDLIDDRVL